MELDYTEFGKWLLGTEDFGVPRDNRNCAIARFLMSKKANNPKVGVFKYYFNEGEVLVMAILPPWARQFVDGFDKLGPEPTRHEVLDVYEFAGALL